MARAKKKSVENRVTTNRKRRALKNPDPALASFIRGVSSDVKSHFAETISLRTFRATASDLSKEERLRLIEQALVLIEQNYVHLPLKQAMHATDPVQGLKLLQHQVENDAVEFNDLHFHRSMTEIFMSVRDLHTNYILPTPFSGMVAFVPFMIEEFSEENERRYLVTNVSSGFSEPPFGQDVEVVSWNGIPIERAIEIQGNRFAGSNMEARRARGVATLTVRRLAIALPPDEDFVILGYIDADGELRELRTEWLVISAPVLPGELLPPSPREADLRMAAAMAMDMEMLAVQHIQKLLYADDAVADEARVAKVSVRGARESLIAEGAGFAEFVPTSVMEGQVVNTSAGRFGHIRIRSFAYEHDDLSGAEIVQSFVDRFIELAEQLPQEGLIVDIRGNGGGFILAGERLLQLLTPRVIQPEPTQFINTALNLEICRRHSFLNEWVDSLNEAVVTGAQYSRGFPITSSEEANDIGQRYFGPVVLITDGLVYSTGDIFAAGFQDHGIGPIIGVHGNTGAGGANVWRHDLLTQLLPTTVESSPYAPLPNSAGMRVSIRRTMRVLENAGTPVEDLGVVPDHRRELTRNDLLNGNEDLLNFAGEVLSELPVRQLSVKSIDRAAGSVAINIETLGLDGCDVFADGRAQGSVDISDGETQLTVSASAPSFIELNGFAGDRVVAVRRLELA